MSLPKATHFGYLITDFQYVPIGSEIHISVSYVTPDEMNQKTLRLQEIQATDESFSVGISCEKGMIITKSKKLHNYYHAIYLFDFQNRRKTVLYDIVDNDNICSYFERYQNIPIRSIPLKMNPKLLPR